MWKELNGRVKYLLKTILLLIGGTSVGYSAADHDYVFEAGHSSLQEWLLPDLPPIPDDNRPTASRIELGKKLFFDPRLSGHGNMSCATCHSPMLGWSDGLATARGFKSQILPRATPTIVNVAYNSIQMWDGRKRSLEDQAIGPMEAVAEMHANLAELIPWLGNNEGYKSLFKSAYPNEGINRSTLAKAIASFERTIISNDSPFDQWVKGNSTALSKQQILGFKLFVSEDKGNCAVCHSAPNFTDNGFHNIGLKSFGNEPPDLGRFSQKPLAIMKGAFKTPTLRDITLTAPYFHDGSITTLTDVVDHYVRGGDIKTNLSPNMKTSLDLNSEEVAAIIAFLQALEGTPKPITLPMLPL